MNKIFEQPLITVAREELARPDRLGEVTRAISALSIECSFDFPLDLSAAEESGMLAIIEDTNTSQSKL